MEGLQYNFTFRQKDNGWQVILSYKDKLGKWRQKSKQGFPRKKDAQSVGDVLLKAAKEEYRLNASPEVKGITLREMCEAYIEENADNLEYNSKYLYQKAVSAFTSIVDIPIAEIKYADIRMNLNQMGYSPKTKNTYLIMMKTILSFAKKRYKIISNNPADGIPSFKVDKVKIHALSNEEFDSLMNYYMHEDFRRYGAILIAGYVGARYGEIVALEKNDIDLSTNQISINKQMGLVAPNQYAIKSVKNKNGIRKNPIPPILSNVLKKALDDCDNDVGQRLFRARTSRTQQINNAIRKIVPTATIHCLRHTYATRLLANGVDVKTVAALLGDNVDTVIKTYIHYTEDMRQAAANDINRIFG